MGPYFQSMTGIAACLLCTIYHHKPAMINIVRDDMGLANRNQSATKVGPFLRIPGSSYSGWGVIRRYCFPDLTSLISTPLGKNLGTSSGFTDGNTMHFSPCCKTLKERYIVTYWKTSPCGLIFHVFWTDQLHKVHFYSPVITQQLIFHMRLASCIFMLHASSMKLVVCGKTSFMHNYLSVLPKSGK